MTWNKIHLAFWLIALFSNPILMAQQNMWLGKKWSGIESSYFFEGPDGKVRFAVSTSHIAIKVEENNIEATYEALLGKISGLGKPEMSAANRLAGYDLFPITDKLSTQKDIENLLQKVKSVKGVISAQVLLLYADGTPQIATERVMVKLRHSEDIGLLNQDAKKMNFTVAEVYTYDKLVYFIDIKPSAAQTSMAISNQLATLGKYAATEPIFIKLLQHMNPDDPYLDHQWSLENQGTPIQYGGTPGADMKVIGAWALSAGSNAIKVAVIDEGVDLNHPDLIPNLLPGFDATGLGSNGGHQGNDAHGTACAGIIAAAGNNGLGIAGVAYQVKIVPIRIAYSSGSNWVTNDTWISTAIDWAWNQGAADVLSNSWGGGSASTLINDAISRATTQGRGNKGAAVLFAAGNNNGAVSYPANNNNTIAVIAMSMCNERKSFTSCDGELWGSNFGLHADVAAPGVKIYTTDISGNAGYTAGDYVATFNGTSSACPNAAGVMALILSVNPNLTYIQARQMLESSCEKVGGYAYTANPGTQPNGTWSNEMGYGGLNALAALQMASGLSCGAPITSPNVVASHNNLCIPTTVTLSLQSAVPFSGASYQWEESGDGNNFSIISGATGHYLEATVSTTKWFRCQINCGGLSITAPVVVNYLDPTISVYPHIEKFNASSLPCGWTVQDVNNDSFKWSIKNTGPRTPSYCAVYNKNTAQAANDWLFSPPMHLDLGKSYGVRFWYKGRSVTLPESLEVKWGSAPNENAMTSSAIFSNANINNTTYLVANSAVVTPIGTGIYYIGFKALSNANMYDLYLDDVTFEELAPCSQPLSGGTISGPSSISAGNSTSSTWTVVGYTGSDLQWQISSNGGNIWTDVAGHVSPALITYIAATGNYLLRVKVGSYNCPDAYSPAFPVTVLPRIGDLFTNPILASGEFEEYLNTGPLSGFASDYTGPNAQASNDVFFRYTTGPCTDSLWIGTCGSSFDTYVHVLDANGVHILSQDDTPLCGQQAVFEINVDPTTTYYIVLEGWNTSQGAGGIGFYEVFGSNLNVAIAPGGSTAICEGDNLTLTASSGDAYLWSTGSSQSSITVSSGGVYSVTVTNLQGCSGTASIMVSSTSPTSWYADADGDGFGNIEFIQLACTQPVGFVANSGDCNDQDAQIHAQNNFYADLDLDGVGGSIVGSFCLLLPPTGWSVFNTDCDDNNPAVTTPILYYLDADSDGFGSSISTTVCSTMPPSGYVVNNTDCNDNNPTIYPGAPEICGNNVDENCNQLVDEGCCNINLTATTTMAMCSNVQNGSINVTVSNGMLPYTYLWSNGATTEDLVSLFVGTYHLTVTDGNSCSKTNSYVVSHNNQSPASPTSVIGPTGACRNQSNVIFSVLPVLGATSYIWILPSGASGSSTTHTISLNFSNNYNTGNICVRAVNACGQSPQICRSILRYTNSPSTPGSINGLAKGICPNSTFSFSINPVTNATAYTWTAPSNATIVSGQGTTSVTIAFGNNFGTSGVLSVKASNCAGNSNNRTLTLQRTPAQPAAITGPGSVCAQAQNVAFSTTNTSAYTYNWVVPSGCTIVSGQGTNGILVNWGNTGGNVAVQAQVPCGAASPFRSKSIGVISCGTSPEPFHFSKDIFEIFPNPNNGEAKILVICASADLYELLILDMQGKLVEKRSGKTVKGENYIELNLSQMVSGLYHVRYTAGTGPTYHKAFIKE